MTDVVREALIRLFEHLAAKGLLPLDAKDDAEWAKSIESLRLCIPLRHAEAIMVGDPRESMSLIMNEDAAEWRARQIKYGMSPVGYNGFVLAAGLRHLQIALPGLAHAVAKRPNPKQQLSIILDLIESILDAHAEAMVEEQENKESAMSVFRSVTEVLMFFVKTFFAQFDFENEEDVESKKTTNGGTDNGENGALH